MNKQLLFIPIFLSIIGFSYSNYDYNFTNLDKFSQEQFMSGACNILSPFTIQGTSNDGLLDIIIPYKNATKSQIGEGDNICLFEISKSVPYIANKIGCNQVADDNGSNIVKFKITSSNGIYVICNDPLDYTTIKFNTDKKSYNIGDDIIISSNELKTINGNTLKNGFAFFLNDGTISYSKDGKVEFKTKIISSLTNSFEVYIILGNQKVKISTDNFEVSAGDSAIISSAKPEIINDGSRLKISFNNDKIKISGLEFQDKNNENNTLTVEYQNDFSLNIDNLVINLYGSFIPEKSIITVKGYALNSKGEKIYTDTSEVNLDIKDIIDKINQTQENKFDYLGVNNFSTGINSDFLQEIDKNVDKGEIQSIINKNKDEFDKQRIAELNRAKLQKLYSIKEYVINNRIMLIGLLLVAKFMLLVGYMLLKKFKK